MTNLVLQVRTIRVGEARILEVTHHMKPVISPVLNFGGDPSLRLPGVFLATWEHLRCE